MYESKDLWNKFKASLIKNINDTKIETLRKAAFDNTFRTNQLYKRELFKKISQDLDLDYDHRNKEFLRVDAIFGSKTEWNIPVVFIESENVYDSEVVRTELPKLCFLNAPLKVLFLWTPWHENKKKEIHDDDFYYFLDDFKQHIKFNGYLAVIVGDVPDNKRLRYHSFVYGEDCIKDENMKVDNEEKLVDITL